MRAPWLARFVELRPGEGAAAVRSFAYFFTLLCGYYVLRPLREEMGIRGGVENLPWNFTAVFLVMLAAVPVYSALVARVPPARAVPGVYRFFLVNLLAFYALLQAGVAPAAVARTFFVWVSVYNLFVVSIFWSVMADAFTSDQGKRLFGFIAAGGSAGAIAGPAVAGLLAGPLGIPNLVLVSAGLLEASTWLMRPLVRRAGGRRGEPAPGLGGSAWSGIALVIRDRYLLGIAAQQLLFTLGSTVLYFHTARLVAAGFPDPARRTALFAAVDLAVNLAAVLTQTLATGALVRRLGIGVALAIVPALTTAGFLGAAAWPTLAVLATVQALRRAASYAVERPAREVLFTVVTREEKYKSKGFIDTVVYRAGDASSAWLARSLAAAVGVAGSMIAAVPVGVAGVALAAWLARRQAGREGAGDGPP